ncbi:MAG: dihydroorotase [Flavobacteriaceae bacterium]
MNILIKSATILDHTSPYNTQTKDILIENGIITKIDDTITSSDNTKEIAQDNLHVSQGWFDSSVSFGEPGFEERETLDNGLNTAGYSGFTDIMVNPSTNPVIDNGATVAYIKNKGAQHTVNIHPIGALTKASKGTDLAELYDMQQSGAVAFGDFQSAIENPNMLKIALQYTQNFNGIVLSYPQENKIAGKGIVNEEETSTKLGLKGIPNLAEELHVIRDLYLLEYAGGKLHIPTISTAKSVQLIREAKLKGLDVTCSVSVLHLILTDDVITDFNTNYKILPPLRTALDRKVLLAGIQDGTIDFVTSNHCPIDVEHKVIEFDHAQYGSIGLETIFGALNSILSTDKVVQLLTQHKERFGLTTTTVKEGQAASLTLFNPDVTYQFSKEDIKSTSKNSALLGSTLKGKAIGVINNNQLILA